MKPRSEFTEKDNFLIEAAWQLGFEILDDDAEYYGVSDEALVEFVKRVQAPLLVALQDAIVGIENGTCKDFLPQLRAIVTAYTYE